MKTIRFVSTWETSIRAILILSVVVVLQSVAIGILGAKLYQTHERVVIVPPLALQNGNRMEIAWKSANQEYSKSFAMYVASLLGNVTPQNVNFVADVVSGFVSPKIYTDVRAKILAMAQDEIWATSGQASYFVADELIYEDITNRTFVVGKFFVTQHSGGPEYRPVVYEMVINIKEGRPIVEYLTSYEGSKPRTIEWLRKQPKEVKEKYHWLIDMALLSEDSK